MRHLLAMLACALVVSVAAHAQTPPIAPLGITDYTVIATVETGDVVVAATETKAEKVRWLYTVLRTASGAIEYTVDAGTMTFTGDHDLLATVTASQIFDIVAERTVMFGVAGGYGSCDSTGVSSGVTTQSCVSRSSTGLAPSGTSLSRRVYGYTCTAASLASVAGTFDCGTTAEPTWASGGGSIQ